MFTIRQLLLKYQNKISPQELELLIAFILQKNKEWVITHPEFILNNNQILRLQKDSRRRQKGCPVAVITGHKEFYGLDLFVDKNVLIPRPETELLAEEMIKEINKRGSKNIILIDIGTGSGCIPIAVAKNITRPVKIIAVDISDAALRIARKNAKRHKIKIKNLRGRLLAPLLKYFSEKNKIKAAYFITANLPYLTEKQFASEPSIQKEPKKSLVADNNLGLSLYEKLFSQIQKTLSNKKILIMIEIDPRQSAAALKLAQKYFPDAKTNIKKDLSGRDRLVIIEKYS